MTTRIGIVTKTTDTRAAVMRKKLLGLEYKNIVELSLMDIFTVDKNLSAKQLNMIASKLSNPITQNYIFQNKNSKSLPDKKFTIAIEIGFLPGVTDNVSHTVKELVEDNLKIKFTEDEDIYSSQVIFISGKINQKECLEISGHLHNPLIQRAHIKSYATYIKDGGMDIIVPKVNLIRKPHVTQVDLNISDVELIKIGKSGILNIDGTRRGPLALDLIYMKTIQEYFQNIGRKPTDIEVESLAQTWSEHCKHTIFADPLDEIKDGLYKHYIKRATKEIRKKKFSSGEDFCVSVFTDNSGAIAFDENYLITHKVETHNSPSALDPFGGAITGIVGVNRDTIGFGLGAKPIANFYGFCLADPREKTEIYKDRKLTQKILPNRRIMDGVIDGINAGGNQSGIPTPQGFIYFDERFRGKPLVFAGTVGLIPRKIKGKLSHVKKANPGDLIVMIGGRVGKDGVHGATFSSVALDSGSPATAVQIGDPITQKKLSDAIIKEARDQMLYTSITDNGAGGLSCSVAEMSKESGGCIVNLEKVPLKYPGLDPWEIWISESQERMTLAIPKKNWKRFSDLMKRRDVEATIIGQFTKSGKCVVNYKEKKIVDIDLSFLHDGLPKRTLKSSYTPRVIKDSAIEESDPEKSLLGMLKRLNITSYEFISRQYDHIVQGNAVLGPLQGRGRVNTDASVIRPVLSSQKGVVMSHALYPAYSEIDPYNMAAACVDTAIRNAVAVGADPEYLALLDNFCWCSSTEPERLAQLKLAAKACYDYALAYETPFISGKDSMFNDFKGFSSKGSEVKISIPPTLLISSVSVITDVMKTVSLDAKIPGDLIYVIGETYEELAGSEYFAMQKATGNNIPKVNAVKNRIIYNSLFNAIQRDLVASSISIGRGGLGIAIAKKAIGGQLGVDISLKELPGNVLRADFALFSESQGRIVVTINPKNKTEFESVLRGCIISCIGKVTSDPTMNIQGINGEKIIELAIDKITKSYRKTFKTY